MIIQTQILKEKIIRAYPGQTLYQTLSQLSTSHDAAFVFDKNKFLGIINPYYCLIRKSYPGNAKVEHCLHHPPKIRMDYSLAKTASLFIESKVHYLPVFDSKDSFCGIISARDVLKRLLVLPVYKKTIKEAVRFRKKPLTVVYEDDSVSMAVNLFKSSRLSKLIVINRDMKLKGVLSYYDLINFLVQPKNQGGKKEKIGNKVHMFNQKVRSFMKTYVLTLKIEDTLSKAGNLIIDKKIGSVVVVDDKRYPVSIITTRDLLKEYVAFSRFLPVKSVFSKIGKLLLNR